MWAVLLQTKSGQINKFILTVQEFDEQAEIWITLESNLEFSSLDEAKEALYDSDFFCDANAEIDNHGAEIFKGESK